MTLRRGEVVLIRIDFHQAPVTSQQRRTEFDVPLREWREAGLNVASTIRVHKLAMLPKDQIVRHLGDLTGTDQAALAEALRRAFLLDH